LASASIVVVETVPVDVMMYRLHAPESALQFVVVVVVAMGVAPPEHEPSGSVLKFGQPGSVQVAPEQVQLAPLPPVPVEARRQ
jgi:hypothetical protein